MKVAAVVVTYNRRELLARTLAGLEAQERPVDHLVVIDNASTDDTGQWLDQREFALPATVRHLPENTGGAGGFALGADIAFGLGMDGIWLMDDDTVARPGALGALVSALERTAEHQDGAMPSFACSMVVWTDGSLCEMNTPETSWDWPRLMAQGLPWQLVNSASFVSCLVTREAMHAVGLPKSEYFIWYDDAEYTKRLARYHRPGIFVPESVVDHLLASNRGVNFGDVNESNIWKFEYGVRNQVATARSMRSLTVLAGLGENMFSQLRGSGVPMGLRLRLVKAGLKGAVFRAPVKYPRTVR